MFGLLRRFDIIGKEFSETLAEEAANKLGLSDGEELEARVGRGELSYQDVTTALFPEMSTNKAEGLKTLPPVNEGWFGIGSAAFKFRIPGLPKKQQTSNDRTLAIRGATTNLPVTFAPDGGAVPGDRIIGILDPGIGVTIYPIHSPSLSKFEDKPELWLDVRWDSEEVQGQLFPARLVVSVLNEPGTLALIAQIIGDHGSNIERLELIQGASDFTDIEVDLLVADLKVLTRIMAEIRRCSVVSTVARINK